MHCEPSLSLLVLAMAKLCSLGRINNRSVRNSSRMAPAIIVIAVLVEILVIVVVVLVAVVVVVVVCEW